MPQGVRRPETTNHVVAVLADVVVVVHGNDAGLVVRRELPQAIHLLAILSATVGQRPGWVAAGTSWYALHVWCPCVEQEAKEATTITAQAIQASIESCAVFMLLR